MMWVVALLSPTSSKNPEAHLQSGHWQPLAFPSTQPATPHTLTQQSTLGALRAWKITITLGSETSAIQQFFILSEKLGFFHLSKWKIVFKL